MRTAPSPRNARMPRIVEGVLARCALVRAAPEHTARMVVERLARIGVVVSPTVLDDVERRVIATHERRLPPERATMANTLVRATMLAIRALLEQR